MKPPRPRLLPKEIREWLLAFAAALCLAAVVTLAAMGHPVGHP